MYLLRLSPLLLLIPFVSCKKYISAETVLPGPPITTTVESSFKGKVVDQLQQPVPNATVSIAGITTTTDSNGIFLIPEVKVDSEAAMLSIRKEGYLNGIRTLIANANNLQYTQVELAPKDLTTSFAGNSVGKASFANMTIVFSPNQLLTARNQVYGNTVSIAADYISPASTSFSTRMPGDLRGIDNNGKQVGLQSFGIVGVDLRDTANAPIHPDGSHPVNITVAIPGPYLNNAPAQIGLWYLDTISGYWKQEATAYKVGNTYIGNIRQGTRWQFAIPFDVVSLDINIFEETGEAVANMQTTIASKIDFIPTYSYTNAQGHYSGKVPQNDLLILTLTDPCGNKIFQKEIGPFSANSSIDTIKTPALAICQ